jgi:hypothetical protein
MSWIERAEAALRGQGSGGSETAAQPDADDVELLPGRRPTLFDAFGRRALLAPFLAGFFWAAAIFREGMHHPLEPIALALRLLAYALSVRCALLGLVLGKRLRVILQRERYKLVLTTEGLLLRTPLADYAVPKDDIVDVREPGAWQERGATRWADVYLIMRPSSGRTHLALPPVFDRTPGTLAERLMRWRGVVEPPAERPERVPADLPSKLFDAAAAGKAPEGVAAIPQGRGWMQRAPYATVLLGVALLEGYLRMPAAARGFLGAAAPGMALLCLIVAPAFWFLVTRRDVASRKGIALVLAPAELLLRTRSGTHRVAWSNVAKLQIAAKTVWTILQGTHASRVLVIMRKDDDPVQYSEAYLGVPAEVVAGLCEGYRKGVLP